MSLILHVLHFFSQLFYAGLQLSNDLILFQNHLGLTINSSAFFVLVHANVKPLQHLYHFITQTLLY